MSVPVTIRISDELNERYMNLADATGRSRSFYMELALNECINRIESRFEDDETALRIGNESLDTISDVMWLNSFVARLRDCLENGELLPFSVATPEQVDRTETGSVLLYVDDSASRNYMDIVFDMLPGEVLSTFSDMLKNIDVRVFIEDDEEEQYVTLAVFPKGKAKATDQTDALLVIEPSDPLMRIAWAGSWCHNSFQEQESPRRQAGEERRVLHPAYRHREGDARGPHKAMGKRWLNGCRELPDALLRLQPVQI